MMDTTAAPPPGRVLDDNATAVPDVNATAELDANATAELDALRRRLEQARPYNIGFPGATDFDYTVLSEFLGAHLLNNVGDPYIDGVAVNHTKAMEREVVGFVADLLRAPEGNRWGYVTSGGSEGNLYALHLARSLLPDAVAYFSDAVHYSIDKTVRLLGIPAVRVRADRWGEVDYDDLTAQIDRRRHRPAIVVATVRCRESQVSLSGGPGTLMGYAIRPTYRAQLEGDTVDRVVAVIAKARTAHLVVQFGADAPDATGTRLSWMRR